MRISDWSSYVCSSDLQCLPLGALRRYQHIGRPEPRARISHAGVEPLGVEVVAKVVMRTDVAHRARPAVAIEVVRQPRRPAEWPFCTPDIAQAPRVVAQVGDRRSTRLYSTS